MRTLIAIVLVFVGGFLLFRIGMFLYSFLQTSSEIELVFPDGFRGLAKLRGGTAGGIDLRKENGVYIVRFPSTGVLEIKGKLPTLQWYVITAHFASGNMIPVADSETQVGKDELALRQAGLFENREDWFVVGTVEDLKSAIEKKDGFKWPP